MAERCQVCGAKCCQYFCFEIDTPEDYGDFEDIRWYLCHRGVSIHIDDGDWYISIQNPCRMLEAGNRCSIYEDRPLICRHYHDDGCDDSEGGYEYDEEFTSPEQLDAYARKRLGKARYAKDKKAFRARAARAVTKKKD